MMIAEIRATWRTSLAGMIGLAALVTSVGSAAQVTTVDPSKAIDGDLRTAAGPSVASASAPAPAPAPAAGPAPAVTPVPVADPSAAASQAAVKSAAAGQDSGTYREDDLIGAAEGVFGKGAVGLANMIQDVLKKQGQPNAYIVGREGGGAVMVGLRYGSGTLHHKIEGQKPVYWTGPSLGLDLGANAAKTFVLVYNLYNTDDLYERFGAGEGQAYLVGGFHVSYLRRGDVVLIPVRMGAGLRLGVNVGYMKFSKKQRWLPF